jgi:hypothetical protein
MDEAEQEALRAEFLAYARAQNALVEEGIVQYYKFLRGGMKQPLLYISRPGRNVVHIKNAEVDDPRWILIERGDPKKVGRVHEIRIEGDPAQVRSAFYAGFQEFMNAPL